MGRVLGLGIKYVTIQLSFLECYFEFINLKATRKILFQNTSTKQVGYLVI